MFNFGRHQMDAEGVKHRQLSPMLCTSHEALSKQWMLREASVPIVYLPELGQTCRPERRMHSCKAHGLQSLLCWGFNLDGRIRT